MSKDKYLADQQTKIEEMEQEIYADIKKFAAYLKAFHDFAKDSNIIKDHINSKLQQLSNEYQQLDDYISEYHKTLNESIRKLKLKKIVDKLKDLNIAQLDNIYDYLIYIKAYIEHKTLDEDGIKNTCKLVKDLVELQLNSLPSNLTNFFSS